VSFIDCVAAPSQSLLIDSLSFSLSRLCEVTSFSGSTESLRTMFSDACEKMTKEEAQCVNFFLVYTTYFLNFGFM
jgi:hypothetical protein